MAGAAKIDVDISGLQSGITSAKAQLKTLDAQMKANEAEFKAVGNSEQYMIKQTAALNEKLQQNKTVVKQAEEALKLMKNSGITPADTAYQKMQQTLIQAQMGMFQTQSAMNELGTSAQEAAAGADQLTESVNSIGKKISLEQVQNGISSITSGLENAAKKAVDLGKKLWDTIMDSARRADDTATMAQMYGIDLDTFMRMQRLVDSGMDTSIEAMLKGQSKLRDGLGDESKAVKEAFQELGIATKEYQKVAGESGQALVNKDNVQLFWEAGQALMAMSDAAKQESMAQTLFGRSWHELVPLFSEFKSLEEYNAALKEQEVNTEETIRDLAALNDAVSDLEASWTVLKDEILGAIAPALTAGANSISGLLDKLTEYLKTDEGQEMLTKLGTAVSGLFDDLKKIEPEEVVENFTKVFEGIVSGITWISEHWGEVVTGLEAIGVAFIGLKVSSTVLRFVELISGLKGLSFGGGPTGTDPTSTVKTGAVGTAAGAPAGTETGGFAQKVANKAVQATNGFTLTNGAAVGDWFTHNTVLGRQLTNAVDKLFGGNGVFAEENVLETYKETLEKNASTFDQDLRENVLTGWLVDLGTNAIKFWDQFYKDAQQGISDFFNGSGNNEGWDEFEDELAKRVVEDLGQMPEVPIDVKPEAPEDAASSLSEQVGVVPVAAQLVLSGRTLGSSVWGGSGGGGVNVVMAKANGIWSVPDDGYLAMLHKGERVMSAREVQSRSYNSNLYVESMYMNSGADAEGLAAAMAAAQRRVMSGFGS